jgi:micrococcal nuclease
MRTAAAGLSLLLIGSVFLLPDSAPRESARIIRVISADTLTVLYLGHWEEIKLIGSEAPPTMLNDRAYELALKNSTTPDEIVRRGLNACEAVKGLLRYGSQVWLEFDVRKRDRYKRLLGYVYLADGRMLNEIVLRQGLAQLFQVPPNLRYSLHFQEIARLARRDAMRRGR